MVNKRVQLTQTQLGIYLAENNASEEADYNIDLVYYLDAEVDSIRLKKALQQTVNSHPYLKAHIVQDADGCLYLESRDNDPVIVQERSVGTREDALQHVGARFNLLHDTLYRFVIFTLADGQRILYMDFHHILCDGMSCTTFHQELSQNYDGLLNEETRERYGFEEADRETQQRQSAAYTIAKEWYAKTFSAAADVESMPIGDVVAEPKSDNLKVQEKWVTTFVPMALAESDVAACCARARVGISIPFTAALGYVLANYTASDEALFATIWHGRADQSHRDAMGMFVKTLPVYMRFTSPDLRTCLSELKQQLHEARRHSVYSFAEVCSDLDIHPQVCFAYHANLHMYHLLLNGKEQRDEFVRHHRPGLELIINLIKTDTRYEIKIEYNSNVFTSAFIHQFCATYEQVLQGLISNQVSAPYQFERPKSPLVKVDSQETIVSLFRRTAQTYPDRVAVVYNETELTYRQLDELSDALSAEILHCCPQPSVVAILVGRSERMVICALAALKTGSAYQPLDPAYPAERLNFMIQDSHAEVLLRESHLRDSKVLKVERVPKVEKVPRVEGSFILLYTSGSTGTPKGVQLTHHNLVTFCDWYRRYYHLAPEHRVAAYASFGFDADMMDLYPALTTGAAVVIVPEDLRIDLEALSQYLTDKKVTHSFMTTQVGYQFAVTYPNHPTLQHLTIGGEKLTPINPPISYQLYNAYGPTECTIFSSIHPVMHSEPNIPIGRPLDTLHAYVANRFGQPLPWGAAGELILCGDQVAYGYLNQPEKTKAVFIEYDGERAYKTGDIVRYRQNGDIEFIGRRDGQVKIRGFRIELKEIEAVIRTYEGIRDCTVQAFDQESGGKYIVAYIVADHPIDINQLHTFIGTQKPAYMVPAFTMQIDAIPLNINQKVDKKKLPKPEIQNTNSQHEETKTASDMNVLEQRLCQMVTDLTQQTPTLSAPLIYCGLNSILAMRLSVMLYKQLGVKMTGKQILNNATILTIENAVLSSLLQSPITNPQSPITNNQSPITNLQSPLTFAQQGVYTECLKNPDTTMYNIPMDITLPISLEITRVREVVTQVLSLHPMLFAHFEENEEGDIVQRCSTPFTPVVSVITEQSLESVKADFVRPFDLKKDVLHRCAIVKGVDGIHVLLDAHHLVADGGSFDVIMQQTVGLLREEQVVEEDCTYLTFAQAQHAPQAAEQMEQNRQFFAQLLAEMEEPISLPADLSSGQMGHIQEVAKPITFSLAESLKLLDLVTDASFWFAAVAYTLARYANVRDVYMTTVSNGRQDPAVAGTVGMFVNTFPVVAHLREQTIADYLTATAHDFQASIAHENYPFARIAADYGYTADITYAYQLGIIADNTIDGQPVSIQSFGLDKPKFKLGVLMEMYNGVPSLVLQYDDALYSAERMTRLADSIMAVAQRLAQDMSKPLRQVSIMTDAQAQEIVRFAHVADVDVPVRTFHEGISRWAVQTPDDIAIIANDATLTYQQYEDAANRMAQQLIQRGVGHSDRIVLLLPRTSDFLVAVLAVMKCGAAYIPMDPQYPSERIAYILNDSQARFIITTADKLADYPNRALDIATLKSPITNNQSPITNPQSPKVSPDDLAYMIYTSGSTGTPKGVMLQHKGICNYLNPHPANPHTYEVATQAKAVLCSATVSFDLSILEYGTALFNGKTVVFADEQASTDSARLAQLYQQTGADVLSGTPSRIETYLEMEEYQQVVKQCKVIQMGGEKLSLSLLKRLQELTTAHIYNMYGPTEITICCNAQQLNHHHLVTVGKPLPNFTEYIVDCDGNPLPVGVMGELIVSGVGVCPGYHNLPDKTQEAFIEWGIRHERYYRTGDFAQWNSNGEVLILGRTDHQVKLNGLRIELGEIEAVMAQHPAVKQCVAQVKKVGKQDKLVAYYVEKDQRQKTKDESQALEEDIRHLMSEHLTHYMIPGVFVRMESFPITPAGKIDLKHLPEPQVEASTAYVAPLTDAEQDFCDIFAHVLQVDRVGAEDDFFQLGGTSLVAIKVVIAASKKQYEITYSDVFDNPTPRQLAALATKDQTPNTKDERPKTNHQTQITNNQSQITNHQSPFTPLLLQNTLTAFLEGKQQPLETVLLTGATGYLGIHVLYRLLTETEVSVYCPIRSKDNTSAVERLRMLLFYYFEQTFDEYLDKRLFVIEGEVTQRDWMEQLNIPAKMVINCLANVKHFSTGNDIEFVNVESVRNLVIWCCQTGAQLVHISTTSVAGRSVNGQPNPLHLYTEQEFEIGQTLDNQYAQAKYDAEKLILDAILHHNLNGKILRVGNLSARNSDGEFQINFQSNNFLATIRAYQTLGVCPYELLDAPCEFSPIDEVADAVLRLATTPKDCVIFHPTNPHKQLIGDVLREIQVLHQEVRPIEADEFAVIMQEALADEQLAVHLRPLMAYKQKGNKAPVPIAASNAYTTQVLHRLGFHWSVTSWDYVRKFLQAIAGMGYFDQRPILHNPYSIIHTP